jgi:hypothetical protein
MTYWPAPPPTRILNWQQLCVEADPFFYVDQTRPWWFEFSNRRRFLQIFAPYLPVADTFTLDVSQLGGQDVLG